MAKRHSRREAFYFHTSLTGFIKRLETYYTTIDLRNESSVTGRIVLVDGFMNIELEDAVLYDNRGDKYPFESFFIRARNIRYVHIPLEIPVINIIKDIKEPVVWEKPKKSTKKPFKTSRTQRSHQQTLAELASAQQK